MRHALADYVDAWKRRDRRSQEEALRRRQRAEELLPALTELLVGGFGARQVILIGSLARGQLGLDSDIDLVAAGVPPELFFRAGSELERLAGEFEVDLIPLETATDELLEVVRTEGRTLHDG